MHTQKKVYLSLLRHGPSRVSEISHYTNLNLSYTYTVLKDLQNKGLVSFVVRNRWKYFQAEDPAALMKLIEGKKAQLKEYESELKDAISQLQQTALFSRKKLEASIYSGIEGFKTILEEILRTKQEYLVLGYSPNPAKTLKYNLTNFHNRRIALGIKRRVIASPLVSFHEKNIALQKNKYLPKEHDLQMGLIVFGTKVVIVIIEGEFMAVVIDNKKISENFCTMFEMIWEKLT